MTRYDNICIPVGGSKDFTVNGDAVTLKNTATAMFNEDLQVYLNNSWIGEIVFSKDGFTGSKSFGKITVKWSWSGISYGYSDYCRGIDALVFHYIEITSTGKKITLIDYGYNVTDCTVTKGSTVEYYASLRNDGTSSANGYVKFTFIYPDKTTKQTNLPYTLEAGETKKISGSLYVGMIGEYKMSLEVT